MTEAAYMEQIVHLIAGAGVVLIIIVLIVVNGRVKVAKQQTLQKLLDKNQDLDVELLVTLGLAKKDNPDRDFRRGILYLFMGIVTELCCLLERDRLLDEVFSTGNPFSLI